MGLTGQQRIERGVPICGAKLKHGREGVCTAYPVPGNSRCRIHGGAARKGIDAPSYKNGRYTKLEKMKLMLPASYGDTVEDALSDPDLLSLRPDIAVLLAMEEDLWKQVASQSGDGDLWREVQKTWALFLKANKAKDVTAVNQRINELNKLINDGRSNHEIIDRILTVKEQVRKTKETEMKRIVASKMYITLQEAIGLFAKIKNGIIDGVEMHISDKAEGERLMTYLMEVMFSMIAMEENGE